MIIHGLHELYAYGYFMHNKFEAKINNNMAIGRTFEP